jgi:hypothetical protein
MRRVGVAQSVHKLATGRNMWGSKPDRREIFHILPDRPWDRTRFLYNDHQYFSLGVRRRGRIVVHPLSYSSEVKERAGLFLCSPCETSWPVLVWIWVHHLTVCWLRKGTRGTALQVGMSRVWFLMVSLKFFIDIILPATPWAWGWLSLGIKVAGA